MPVAGCNTRSGIRNAWNPVSEPDVPHPGNSIAIYARILFSKGFYALEKKIER